MKLKRNKIMEKGYLVPYLFLIYLMLGVVHPPGALSSDWKTFIFPEVKGWKQSGEIQTFIPGTLFEYIDGAADLYHTYDFQELRVAEYHDNKKASIIVEIYWHKTPIHAFGIYSQERLQKANFLDIGDQGYLEQNILNFVKGNCYVKMNTYDTGIDDREILLTFAKQVSENLGEKGSLPSTLNSFPEEGKKPNSEKFIAQKFLGYSFLHSAFTAEYEVLGKKFKLFIIRGSDQKECDEMVQRYLLQIGKSGKDIGEGAYVISDPYHGVIELRWKGKSIWGVLDLGDPSLRSKYLNLFEEGLLKGN
jgi:hypothetical protein